MGGVAADGSNLGNGRAQFRVCGIGFGLGRAQATDLGFLGLGLSGGDPTLTTDEPSLGLAQLALDERRPRTLGFQALCCSGECATDGSYLGYGRA